MNEYSITWDATAFFKRLTEANRLARDNGFEFVEVSSLEGFHGALGKMLSTTAYVAVSDSTQGAISTENSPHTRRIVTVFTAMRHTEDSMSDRRDCLELMNELFRQFLSVLIQEKIRLAEKKIFIDQRISFTEIDKYFFTGCACAFFQIAFDKSTDLRYNPQEWLTQLL